MRFIVFFSILGASLAAIVGMYFLWKPAFPKDKRWLFTLLWFGPPLLLLGLSFFRDQFPVKLQMWVANFLMIWLLSVLIAGIFSFLFFLLSYLPGISGKGAAESIPSRRTFLQQVGLVAALLPFSTMWYGILRTSSDFNIQRHRLKFPGLPKAFHGIKIVQISDIHTGSVWSKTVFEKAVQHIREEAPDLVVFTGDLVNNETKEAEPFVDILSQISAPMGVFSILGNHDYGDYKAWDSPEDKQKNFDAMLNMHRRLGWTLLLNEHRVFEREGQRLVLAGVENWGAKLHFKRYGKLSKAMEGVRPDDFAVLLSHDPSHWEAEVQSMAPQAKLTLSGHTHGFQFGVEIPGFKWSPAQYVYKQWAGLYGDSNSMLYVNRGTGCIGYSGRVGIRPEITVLELQKA